MAKWQIGKGLDEYIAQLGNLEFMSPAIAGMAIYDGAKIVADAVRSEIQGLPTTTDKHHIPRDPTQVEKDGLLNGLGIARKQTDGTFINVKIGMDGYNTHKTKKYPQGHPNAMVARSIESGSTVMKRNPFVSRAIRSSQAAAEAAMQQRVDEEITKVMK